MSIAPVQLQPTTCPRCSSQVAPSLLSCPGCGALMRAQELKLLAADAAVAAGNGDVRTEISVWRDALDLLPSGTDQHRVVTAKVQDLGRRIEAGGAPPASTPVSSSRTLSKPGTSKAGWIAGAIAGGLFLLKFKTAILVLLTKGKFLVMGLANLGTVGTMLASVSLYWTLWGWKLALGVIGSIYIHEMGHVSELRKYGFRASAPMFIPGLGALIRLKQHPVSRREDARVGLAGPIWGLGAALAAAAVWFLTGSAVWGVIAWFGALINLFNLVPVFGLDGGRGFRSLTRLQRLLVTAAFEASWFWTSNGLLLLLLIIALGVSIFAKPADEPDHGAFITFVGLIAALSAVTMIPLNLPGSR